MSNVSVLGLRRSWREAGLSTGCAGSVGRLRGVAGVLPRSVVSRHASACIMTTSCMYIWISSKTFSRVAMDCDMSSVLVDRGRA